MSSLESEFTNLISYFEDNKIEKKVNPPQPEVVVEKENKEEINIVKNTGGFNVKSFESKLRKQLVKEYQRTLNYERPYISVTELLGCLRKTYYSRLKFPVDVNKIFFYPYLYMIQKVGNTVHEIIQELYGFDEVEKVIKSEKFKVKGRADAILKNYLYDIKTIDVDKFGGTYNQTDYLQGLIYSIILNEEYNYKIDTITLVYVTRNLKKIEPFDLPYDREKAYNLIHRSEILRKHISERTVPDIIDQNKEECKYCWYSKYCKEDSKKEKVSEAIFLL